MHIIYRDIHEFTKEQLQQLFLSVEWSSGHFPEQLVAAMHGYETVISAWDSDRLVGMICAMDDGAMTAYIHYLLVDPAYQHRGIGKALIEQVKIKYQEYLRIVLIAYDRGKQFYASCGFAPAEHACPMYLTKLWT